MTKEKHQTTDLYHFVTNGTAEMRSLNPLEWFHLVKLALEAGKLVFRRVAEISNDSRTFESLLNHPLKGGGSNERRITPKEVADSLPRTFFINRGWIFLPIKTLEVKEEKGQFFERRLFLLADFAVMVLMDTLFRKELLPNQTARSEKPEISEKVVSCKILTSANLLGLRKDGFEEAIMPYFEDVNLKLGEFIVKSVFDDAVDVLREGKNRVAEVEKAMKPFMEIRTRLGIRNHV